MLQEAMPCYKKMTMVMITMMVRQRGHTLTNERGKEGMPSCKSVLKEILLDDGDD